MSDYEKVPGTVHLVDVEGIFNAKKNGDIVLLPQPSSNINDPLRWSQRKKYLQFGFLWFWAFILAAACNFNGPIFTIWTEQWNCSFDDLNNGVALNFLFLGLGCIFLQPTALKLGRRCVYLAGSIIAIIACIVGGVAKNVGTYYVYNIFMGFGCAPVDSLVEISATDVFFMHERSTAFAAMIFALYLGSNLGPVACGYVVESLSWQWCFWIFLIIIGTILVFQIFFMEDTSFRRNFDESEFESNLLEAIKSHNSTKLAPGYSHDISSNDKLQNLEVCQSDDSSIDYSIPKRTYIQRMRLVELEYNDVRSWLTIFLRPFLLWSFPAVVWGGVVYGAQMMWLSLLITTQSQIFSLPPYNFSAASVGLTNLAPSVGNIIGMLYGGKFVDWLTVKLARRNNGVLEPEFRLWSMIVPTILNAAGILAYGLGSNSGVHWAIPTVLGQGLLGFAMASTGAITFSYVVDSYHKLASESLVLMLFARNLIGTLFTFVFQPWLTACGLALTTWLLFMLSLVINGSFICFIIWGKDLRRWTASRYEKCCNPWYGDLFNRNKAKSSV